MLLTLTTCGVRHEDGSATTPEAGAPVYGVTKPLRGFYSTGFEKSVFGLCLSGKDSCKIPISWDDPFKGFCWAEFSPRATASLERLIVEKPEAPGQVIWLEGNGQIATKPGPFGHLGAYHCQVKIDEVRMVDDTMTDEFLEATTPK